MADKEEPVGTDEPVTSQAGSDDPTTTEPQTSIYPTGLNLIIVMTSLMLGTTLIALDSTIISITTPQISTQFKTLDDIR